MYLLIILFILLILFRSQNKYLTFDNIKPIFIHIPKTAGSSIKTAYANEFNATKGREYHDRAKDLYPEQKKFLAVVRNPWDRIVSAYFYQKNDGINNSDDKKMKEYINKYPDFNTFVEALPEYIKDSYYPTNKHFYPQILWLTDEEGNIIVNDIIHFENLDKELENYCSKENITYHTLSHHRKSNHKNYKDYYNEKSKKIIENLYAKEIKLFNYKF